VEEAEKRLQEKCQSLQESLKEAAAKEDKT